MKTMNKRALKILFDAYWSPSGWKQGESLTPPEDFTYAKSQRVMFDPVQRTHDEIIASLRAVVERLSPRQVADGFLASLSSRRLDWRSALGSFSVARCLPSHTAVVGERQCRICGLYPAHLEQDLNIFNFERFKWGGVRHSNPAYALMDLELFLEAPPTAPTADDLRIFRDLVAAIEAVPSSVTSAALHTHFAATLKSNKAERDQLIAILGLCGILGTPEHPGFAEHFVPSSDRQLPDRRFVDMAYPACWWSGAVGVNQARLQALFGYVL